MFRTNCSMYEEIAMGNPGKVPYCNERDIFEPDCQNCKRPNYTNGDKIRHMPDEELADWIFDRVRCENCFILPCVKHGEDGKGTCKDLWLNWLKDSSELEEKTND